MLSRHLFVGRVVLELQARREGVEVGTRFGSARQVGLGRQDLGFS